MPFGCLTLNEGDDIVRYLGTIVPRCRIKSLQSTNVNASHAVSYALMAYASAYMKLHYTLQFMKNLLTNTWSRGEKDDYEDVLKDCKRLKIKLLPPDINKSEMEFIVEGKAIRVGLCAIRGLGEKAIQEILANKPYDGLEDMLEKVQRRIINKKVVTNLIFAGAFGQNCREIFAKWFNKEYGEIPYEITVSPGIKISRYDTDEKCRQILLSGIQV